VNHETNAPRPIRKFRIVINQKLLFLNTAIVEKTAGTGVRGLSFSDDSGSRPSSKRPISDGSLFNTNESGTITNKGKKPNTMNPTRQLKLTMKKVASGARITWPMPW
jgi:hypothetical protein